MQTKVYNYTNDDAKRITESENKVTFTATGSCELFNRIYRHTNKLSNKLAITITNSSVEITSITENAENNTHNTAQQCKIERDTFNSYEFNSNKEITVLITPNEHFTKNCVSDDNDTIKITITKETILMKNKVNDRVQRQKNNQERMRCV